MLYTINELRHSVFQRVYEVYDIFQNFFGEEYVDLQEIPHDVAIQAVFQTYGVEESECEGAYSVSDLQLESIKNYYSSLAPLTPFILVHWPEVTVTNENDKSVVIQDLYARIEVGVQGTMPLEGVGFGLNRSTFSSLQFASGYVHSHLPSRFNDGIISEGFVRPCLGKGPIKGTIESLKINYDEALWMLFCQELSLYVTVESLIGIPYRKLEEIGSSSVELLEFKKFTKSAPSKLKKVFTDTYDPNTFLTGFTDYYCEHGHLSLCFNRGEYACGMNYYDFIIDISNAFISWFNLYGEVSNVSELYTSGFLVPAFVQNRRFYQNTSLRPELFDTYEDSRMDFQFKGKDVLLHIFDDASTREQTTLLLSHWVAMYILQTILKIVNYHYGKDQLTSISEGGVPAVVSPSPSQAVCYI